MAESSETAPSVNIEDDVDTTPGYKTPAEKSMDEMLNQDQDDESLQKYKQSLLGSAAGAESIFCKYLVYPLHSLNWFIKLAMCIYLFNVLRRFPQSVSSVASLTKPYINCCKVAQYQSHLCVNVKVTHSPCDL